MLHILLGIEIRRTECKFHEARSFIYFVRWHIPGAQNQCVWNEGENVFSIELFI